MTSRTAADEMIATIRSIEGVDHAEVARMVASYFNPDPILTAQYGVTDIYWAEHSEPISGRPGWRIDEWGREWYSSFWLSGAGPVPV